MSKDTMATNTETEAIETWHLRPLMMPSLAGSGMELGSARKSYQN